MFSGSSFIMVVPPISWDVDVRQKSKMAAKLPEIPITLLVLQIHMSFQNNTWVYDYIYETSQSPTIMADATLCQKSKMAAN